MNRQTTHAKANEVPRQWHHVDATDQVLGRLASRLAVVLMGKHKPEYTPHQDVGDFVVVTNAEAIKLTGKKLDQKIYERYTGYPNGLKQYPYRRILEQRPEQLIEKAVWRMMPTGRLARQQFKKLKVYRGSEHPHTAQQPQALDLARI
jgi:large subunit ribosomal protein L13